MSRELFKSYILPIAVFSGGMIGVGFLSLPYIASQVGIWWMIFCFAVITALVVGINLIFHKLTIKTPDFKRLPGFAGFYLGKWAKAVMMVSIILGTLGVLLAYLLVGGDFLKSAFAPVFSGNLLTYALIYFVIVSIVIYFDIKIISRTEFWVLLLILLAIFCVLLSGIPNLKLSNIFNSNFKSPISNLFLPYGALLFSLWGAGLMPEVEEMLRGQKAKLKKVVIISTIGTAVFYFLFMVLILGLTGNNTSPTALDGLTGAVPAPVVALSLLAGALATLAAFITQGIVLKKTLMFDLKIKHWQAFVMTCFTPMVFFLLGVKSFIPIISLVGGALLGLNGILILLMYKKIGGKKIIIYPLSLIFILGIIYELIYFAK